jgi:hypothetical protein
LLSGVESVLDSQSLYILNRVGSRRKNEVDRSGGSGISIGLEENLFSRAGGITLNEFLTTGKSLGDEVGEGNCDTIGSEAPGDEHLLERQRFESLPVKGEFLGLRGKVVIPVLESARSFFLEVSGELLESIKLNETLDAVPSSFGKPILKRCGARSVSGQGAVH